mgnify:CR=1 FL=1
MKRNFFVRLVVCLVFLFSPLSHLWGLTANEVRWEFHPKFIRIYITYTVIELKELREAQIEFKDPKKAREVFWKLVEGADFQLDKVDKIRFTESHQKPESW